MKITFVSPTNMSGGVRVVGIYAQKLMALGHDVRVFSTQTRKAPLKTRLKLLLRGKGGLGRTHSQPSHLDALGSNHHRLPHAGPVTDTDLPDADIVIATWWETAEWVAGLSAGKGQKFYLLQGYEMFDHLPKDRVAATYGQPLHKIAVSGYIQAAVAQHAGARDIRVVPNGVDTGQFNAPVRRKNKALTVGFLYSTATFKRVELAISAIMAARQQLPHLRVKVFGARVPPQELALPDWVEFHHNPPQAEIPKIYAGCDIWLFTSAAEGFGLPLLEAMACRTPVLATRAGAAPDLIDTRNGFLLDATPAAFRDQILAFDAMSDAQWQIHSAAAYRTAQAHTWEDAAALLQDHLAGSLSP